MKSVIICSIVILFSLFQLTESRISSGLSNLEKQYRDQKNQQLNEDYFTERVLSAGSEWAQEAVTEITGIWKAYSWVTGEMVSSPTDTGRFMTITDYYIDFNMCSGFFESTYTGIIYSMDMCGDDGESDCSSDRRIRRVLDGEDYEEMEEEGGYNAIRIPLTAGYAVLSGCDDIEEACLDIQFEDDEFDDTDMGSIRFRDWSMVDEYGMLLWGVYETADDDEYLVINWDGICYKGETSGWLEVDQECFDDDCSESFDISVTVDEDDIEISIDPQAQDGTLTLEVDDDTVAYTMLEDSERGAYLEGSWSWFEELDGEDLAEDGCSTWDAFLDDGITFGESGDMTVGDQSITYDGEQATDEFYTSQYMGVLGYQISMMDATTISVTGYNSDYEMCGSAAYVMDVDDEWSCPDGQDGCEQGSEVTGTEMGFTGQYYMERKLNVDNIVFRREKCSDCETYETVKGLRTVGEGEDDFDLMENLEADYVENLCGQNVVFPDTDYTYWTFTVGDDCNLIFKPFRGVKQAVQYTYAGSVDDFVDEVVPAFFQALYDAIILVDDSFKLSQIFLTDCFINNSRLRFRILDDTIEMSYEITPEETEEEEEADEDAYDDVTTALATAAAAASDAVEDIEIEGVEIVEGSFTSVEVVVEYGEDPFETPEEDDTESSTETESTEEPSSEEDDSTEATAAETDDDDDTSAINMSFALILMTTLLAFI